MGKRKLRDAIAIISLVAVASISFYATPSAKANGVDLTGNYKCSDGTPAPIGYDPFQTYYVIALAPNGYEVATGSGELCTGPVVIFDGVTSIGESAFENAFGVTSITISNSVTSIGIKAFKNATGITSVELGNSVTTIGDNAFHNVYAITSLSIPDSVTTIGVEAFRNIGVSDIYIPDSVTTIGDYAFYSSVNLSRVQIGSGVTTYGLGVFDLTSLSETESTDPYPQTVFYCGSFNNITNADFDGKGSGPTCGLPSAPDLTQTQVLGENSVRLSIAAPTFTGAGTVTQYEVLVKDSSGANVLDTQSFTPSPTIQRGGTATLTVVDLTAATAYRFSVRSVKTVNSVIYRSSESSFLSATTNASTGGGGTGGGGTGGGGTGGGGTGADELKRQQDAAASAKQKQYQELREILSLVPTIAGLAQGIAGLGNSLLLPKKCVKGKLVKNIKAGDRCPKGYKTRR